MLAFKPLCDPLQIMVNQGTAYALYHKLLDAVLGAMAVKLLLLQQFSGMENGSQTFSGTDILVYKAMDKPVSSSE